MSCSEAGGYTGGSGEKKGGASSGASADAGDLMAKAIERISDAFADNPTEVTLVGAVVAELGKGLTRTDEAGLMVFCRLLMPSAKQEAISPELEAAVASTLEEMRKRRDRGNQTGN